MEELEKLHIFKRLYDLSKWFLQHTGKFPKSHRFSVAVKIEITLLELIEYTAKAKMRMNKMASLIVADENLFLLKILTRMSFELRFINIQTYEYAAKELVEIGRMLGGWIKQQKNPA